MNPIRTFTSRLERIVNPLWHMVFFVPTDIVSYYAGLGIKRFTVRINNQFDHPCAFTSNGNNTWYIHINKKACQQLGISEGSTLQLQIQPNTSTYGLPVTPELNEVLESDPEGATLFNALTPGRQRTLIYWSGQVKNTNGRIKRALAITEHLKLKNGNVDFKELIQLLRRS